MIAKKLNEMTDGEIEFNCIKVYVSWKAMGWEWFIEEEHDDYYTCFVQSPLCHEGEFGSVMKSELNSIGAIAALPEECMSPDGWGWVKE